MSKSKVTTLQLISPTILQDNVLMLGEEYVKSWKIPIYQPLTVQFGSFRHRVTILSISHTDGLRMNNNLAGKMGLIDGLSLRATYKKLNQTVYLGPLIGVLVSRDHPNNLDRPFGANTSFCSELVDACQSQGAWVCFFTPDHIQDFNSIKAWIYANKIWKQTTMPIPNVINNRLSSRKLENKASVQQFMKEVKSRHHSSIFNEKFLEKNEVFDALSPHAELVTYLPKSHLLRNFTTLKSMFERYSIVFLKPAYGSMGKGIIRITRMLDGSYELLYTTISGTSRQNCRTLAKVFSTLSGKLKTCRYQIQQGLRLIQNHNRPVDFRALVQKNATGKWTLTSIVARIASKQHFVSNLARGGSLSTVKEAIRRSNLSASAKKDVYTRLKRAALVIAEGVDKYIPAHFGEFGVDLAVDQSGKVWLLEVNSKPSKHDNTPLSDLKIRPSAYKIVDYSRFLTGL